MELPPYGFYPRSVGAGLAAMPVPTDWIAPGGRDDATRTSHYDRLRDALLVELADTLWPQWRDGAWHGAAAARMEDLTRADFEGFRALHRTSVERIRAIAFHDRRHFDLQALEDEGVPSECLALYAPTLARDVPDFGKLWLTSQVAKAGNASTWLKARLQRPRPYQVAMLLGMGSFDHAVAKSGNTPSMISGHAIQGFMGVASAFEIAQAVRPLTPAESAGLEQLAVDVGDRRVYGGIHYPADNLGSWLVALRLAPFVYRDPEIVRGFMKRALGRSAVMATARASGNAAYAPVLAAIDGAFAA